MNIRKLAVGFGIAVLFPMLVHYGVSSFSAPPDWGDYRLPEWETLGETATTRERQAVEAERSAVRERFDEHA